MFSKGNQEKKPNYNPEVEDFLIAESDSAAGKIGPTEETAQPQPVKLVEKISSILSPYFIVIVGLYLYDDNFFFGTILIVIGILSLLKFSYQDAIKWMRQLKSFWSDLNSRES